MKETLADFQRRVSEGVKQSVDAYAAGYDCGLNGPNTKNCAIANFATRERTAAWERGKAEGMRVRAQGHV
jgi:post-segregation antitoxin (ccd killing protein)